MACLQPDEGYSLISELKQKDPTSEVVFLLEQWRKDRERVRTYIQNMAKKSYKMPNLELDHSKMKIDEDGGIFIPFKLDTEVA